ncbi:MAG: NAD(P)H-hydrate epimerase [Treponema sp.]|nr:NAD(P)H-hydrate epimerase [Treponema sp.]
MKAVYYNSSALEAEAKKRFNFPDFIMMENAAAALEKKVFQVLENKYSSVRNPFLLILCGKGNNGADGLALARRIYGKTGCINGKLNCKVLLFSNSREMSTEEGKRQLLMAESLGLEIIPFYDFYSPSDTFSESFSSFLENPPQIILDCLYGTGFKGSLPDEIISFFYHINNLSDVTRIACDIPSGIDRDGKISSEIKSQGGKGEKIAFKADYTLTMGVLKTSLFTDSALDFTGKIETAPLGLSSDVFESCGPADAWLFEKSDQLLPVREKASSHKGNYGHTAVILGQKCGAGILSAEASLRFGAGLSSCVSFDFWHDFSDNKEAADLSSGAGSGNLSASSLEAPGHRSSSSFSTSSFSSSPSSFSLCSRPENFKISPEIMLCDSLPESANCLLLGSGFGRNQAALDKAVEKIIRPFIENFSREKSRNMGGSGEKGAKEARWEKGPSLVLDADFFYYEKISSFLCELEDYCKKSFLRVILTPHPKELYQLLKALVKADWGKPALKKEEENLPSFEEFLQNRFYWVKKFSSFFPDILLLSKSAVNYISQGEKTFIVSDGSPALAKAGSGDVLAGLCGALLAQGYDSLTAACTASSVHANAAKKAENNFSLTPLSLIGLI